MFNISDLSKHRSSLMGIAILEVMVAHFSQWMYLPSSFPIWIIKPFTGLVFTEGFLFLSGLGLFYSWTKNPSTKDFFKKRFLRLFLPYFIILLPFSIYAVITTDTPLAIISARLLTLKFWIWGKDGMWYISASLLLYALFPLIYNIIFSSSNKTTFKSILISVFFILIAFLIFYFEPSYYKKTSLGYPKLWIFVIGMLAGFYAYNEKKTKHIKMTYSIIFLTAIFLNVYHHEFLQQIGDGFLRLATMPIVCIILKFIQKQTLFFQHFFEWFGKYSLELYIIHLLLYEAFMNSYNYFQPTTSIHDFSRLCGILSIFMAITSCKIIHNTIDKLQKKGSLP